MLPNYNMTPKKKDKNRKKKLKAKKDYFMMMTNRELETKFRKIVLTTTKTLFIIALVCGLLIATRSVLNRLYLYSYSHGSYYEFPESLLQVMYFGENYVAPYNIGNADYQMGQYQRAANHYMYALQMNPPEEKDCKIRINLALALCHYIDFDSLDLEDNAQIDEAINILLNARLKLTENGCACEEVDMATGHSEDAEKLKHDIDEMLKKLQSQKNQNEQNDQQNQNGEGGEDENESDGGEGTSEESSEGEGEEKESDGQDEEKQGLSGQSEDEKEKQQALKDQLDEQKEALDNGAKSDGNGGYTYEYIETGNVEGYGEGTSW